MSHSTADGLPTATFIARGEVFVVRRHQIDYLRPAFLGDELRIETRVIEIGVATCNRQTKIVREKDGLPLANAITEWAYIDLARGRPIRIPADIRGRITVEPAFDKRDEDAAG